MDTKYFTREELSNLIGTELEFVGFGAILSGILTYDNNKYWLPFCGHVNAETILIVTKTIDNEIND